MPQRGGRWYEWMHLWLCLGVGVVSWGFSSGSATHSCMTLDRAKYLYVLALPMQMALSSWSVRLCSELI